MNKFSLFFVVLLAFQVSSFPLDEEYFKREADCYDRRNDCQAYANGGGCDPKVDWHDFMKENCRKTCNMCKDCKDNQNGCPFLAKKGHCKESSIWFNFMTRECRLSCNLCKDSSKPTTPAPCLDKNGGCPSWYKNGYCEKSSEYYNYMMETCRLSCKVCKGSVTPTEKPKKPTNTGAVLIENISGACLKAHNDYRVMHNAPLLTLDSGLTSSSEKYALKLAKENLWKHSEGSYGENLYYFATSGSLDDPSTLCQKAVKAWYDEIKDYNFNSPRFSSATGHFTQVVWKGSKQVGMGISKITRGDGMTHYYAVAQYTPAGNTRGQFSVNVLPKNNNI